MLVYRIARSVYAEDLTGEGARLFGGRWNNAGIPCIYTSDSRALAILEFAANVSLRDMPEDLSIVTISIAGSRPKAFSAADLPPHWQRIKIPLETQAFGSRILLKCRHLAIKLPSVIIAEEHNYLIDPRHPNINNVTIEQVSAFTFDARLKL